MTLAERIYRWLLLYCDDGDDAELADIMQALKALIEGDTNVG